MDSLAPQSKKLICPLLFQVSNGLVVATQNMRLFIQQNFPKQGFEKHNGIGYMVIYQSISNRIDSYGWKRTQVNNGTGSPKSRYVTADIIRNDLYLNPGPKALIA